MKHNKLILSFFMFITGLSGFGCQCEQKLLNGPPIVDLALPELKSEPAFFRNCHEIAEWQNIKKQQYDHEYNKHAKWYSTQPQPTPVNSGASPSSITNRQEADVDEADILKSDNTFFYVARTQSVEIVKKSDLSLFKTITIEKSDRLKLLLTSNQLIVLASKTLENSQYTTTLYVYNISRGFNLKQKSIFEGRHMAARLSEDSLLLVQENDYSWDTPFNISDEHLFSVPCESVQQPLIDDFGTTFTSIHHIYLGATLSIQSSGLIGSRNQSLYINKEHIYILTNGYSWFYWDTRLFSNPLIKNLIVTMFDWQNPNGPTFLAAGQVRGYPNNEWSLKEVDDQFYVATTFSPSSNSFVSSLGTQNRLWKLGHKLGSYDLIETGSSENFGEGESIRSVRFVEDKAYIVTFREFDPLFVFQLDSKSHPRLISHIDVEGFSSYLHPVFQNTLFGVGYAGAMRSIQFSLFDVSNPEKIKLLEQQHYGEQQSQVQVSTDHHAFYINESKRLAALPLSLYKKNNDNYSSNFLDFSGAFVLDLQNLQPLAKLTHSEWIPEKCYKDSYVRTQSDILRITESEGQLITVSLFGIKAHKQNKNYVETRSLNFSNAEDECKNLMPTYYYSM